MESKSPYSFESTSPTMANAFNWVSGVSQLAASIGSSIVIVIVAPRAELEREQALVAKGLGVWVDSLGVDTRVERKETVSTSVL